MLPCPGNLMVDQADLMFERSEGFDMDTDRLWPLLEDLENE